MSRRRFIALAGAATVAGVGARVGVRTLLEPPEGDRGVADGPAAAHGQRVVIQTRYTPAGVPYPVAIALD